MVIARRMADAMAEISHHDEFDYLVVNDDFDDALADLGAILAEDRLRYPRQAAARIDLRSDLLA